MEAAEIRRTWHFSEAEFHAYQKAKFDEMYRHAVYNVPYYAMRSDSYPKTVMTPELDSLPVLTKKDVRENNRMLWAQPSSPLVSYHSTSGSTGSPVKLAASVAERGFQAELLAQWMQQLTGKRVPRTVALTGFFSPKRRALIHSDGPFGTLYLSIYDISPKTLPEIVKRLHDFRPELFFAYPSALAHLGRLLGDEPAPWRDQCVAVTTSETLLDSWRTTIERTVSRRVFNLYGSQEGSHLAYECSAGQLHVHPACGIIEILNDEGEPCAPGEVGRVVVTGLIRKTMPLIRFEIGDSASFAQGECPCGVPGPRLEEVHGRIEDQVRTRDGRRIGLLAFHATRSSTGIEEAQVLQHDYERFEVRLVVKPEFNKQVEEQAIAGVLCDRLGVQVDVTFTYVSQLPRGPNGKVRAVQVLF